MNNEIKLVRELRPCKLEISKNNYRNALFHMFNQDGNAVIEFEDGTVTTYNGNYVVFLDNKFMNYSFD